MEGVRSKDLKSDLEIMLTQHSCCVRHQRPALGSRAALGGAIDRQLMLGVPRPWTKPRQCSGAWRGKDRGHVCLPDLFVPSPRRAFQANGLKRCTCGCSRTPYFGGRLKRSHNLFKSPTSLCRLMPVRRNHTLPR